MKWLKSKLKTKNQLKNHQSKLFKKHQQLLLDSEFYKNKSKIKADLKNYPIINKSIFMDKFDEMNTVNIHKKEALEIAIKAEQTRDFSPEINNITIGLSSGTSGNKGIFLASKSEQIKWVASVLDRVIGLGLKKRKVAFFLRANSNLYESVKSSLLEFNFFDLMESMEGNINKLEKYHPDVLVGQPSVLLEIAKAKRKGLCNILPIKIISVAEVLEPQDRAVLEKDFQQKIHQVYQCTEGFLAATCKEGVLHFNEDFLIIEKKYIDKEEKRFHPIITDLVRTSQPVIRYELNDIIIEKEKCACGSPFMAIESIEGRSDDVLKFKNEKGNTINIFPDFIRRSIITTSDDIISYRLVQKSKNLMECYLEINNHSEINKIEYKVRESLFNMLRGFGIEGIDLVFVQGVELMQGSKLRRVKNEYSN